MGSQIVGKQSIAFQNAVYIAGSASVVGPKEAAGPLGEWFDVKDGDPLFGKETWEQAESEMQSIALQKAQIPPFFCLLAPKCIAFFARFW